MRNEKDPQYYRGGLVYRRESGQLVITMTISRLTPNESTSVTTHAHHLPLHEEAEQLAGGGPSLVGVDLYHFSFSTLKRVVKGRCSCRPRRESIHVKPIIGQVQMH